MKRVDIEVLQNCLPLIGFMINKTMEEIAKDLGISRQYMSELCNNKRKMTYTTGLAIMYLYKEYMDEYFGVHRFEYNVWKMNKQMYEVCSGLNGKESHDYIKGINKYKKFFEKVNEYIVQNRKHKLSRDAKMDYILTKHKRIFWQEYE